MKSAPLQILYVEDNPGDVLLTRKVLDDGRAVNLKVVTNGEAAMEFLRNEGEFAGAPSPDLILLDLNLPRKSGHEVQAEIRQDPVLETIPVVIWTSSQAEADVLASYKLHVSCYVG